MNYFPIFRSDLNRKKKSLGEKSVFRLCTFHITVIQAPIEEIVATCMIHEKHLFKLLARNCIWKKNEANAATILSVQGILEPTPPHTFSFNS